ncbi:MAG: pyridoxal phosphate-dependent aminotransferase, partial [Gemmatimonadota bacterium]
MLSKRTSWDLEPNPLAAALEARRRRGAPILDLMLSNPTQAGLAYPDGLWQALRRAEASAYRPEPLGRPSARAAVRSYYGEKGTIVAAERVLLTASTSEAYAFLFKLLADPGDEVLVPRPSYPLFEFLAGLEGVAARTYPLRYRAGRWETDLDQLAAAITDRSRAIVVVSPNNPTGNSVRPEERAALEDLAAECGLALIADEVFADYPLEAGPGEAASFASGSRVLTFALSGLSKVLGLPQLKLGWMVVDGPADAARDALARLEVIADTYLSVATPVQEALPELLSHR